MPLDEFEETSNGYLFGDTSVFGAEVYVTYFSVAKRPRQTISMMKETDTNIFTWTLRSFSKFNDARIRSKIFIIGDVQWNLLLYPKGNHKSKDKCISVYLGIANDELTKHAENRKVTAEFKLRIRNQLNTNHVEKQVGTVPHMFSKAEKDWGYSDLLLLSDANDISKGYIKNDSLVVEVEFTKVEIN